MGVWRGVEVRRREKEDDGSEGRLGGRRGEREGVGSMRWRGFRVMEVGWGVVGE